MKLLNKELLEKFVRKNASSSSAMNRWIEQIENEMYNRNLKEKELAEMIEINEPILRQIMRGRRSISLRTAKRLHQRLNIDAKLILDYA
jgi:antitoxin component HigA of HigAB toxin-antitoxin module